MTIKIGINGLGRIGRMVVRALVESKNKNIDIKHINNRASSKTSSLLLKYDSPNQTFLLCYFFYQLIFCEKELDRKD